MLLFWWFIHSGGLQIGSPVEKWCLCLLPLSMGSVTAWLIVEHGKVHVLHPDLEELGSFHFLLLRTFTLGTWVSCVRGSQNCLGESSLYQFACHVNEPSCEWVSSPATSKLHFSTSFTSLLFLPLWKGSNSSFLLALPLLTLLYF